MLLFPGASTLLFSVRVPAAVPAEPVRVAVPRSAAPRPNETAPAGVAGPPTAFTVTVRTVVDVCLPGAAVTVRVVDVTGAATLTVREATEGAKLPVGT